MKLYTRGGDAGETGLRGGERVSKAALRVHAYGELDELGSLLGLARGAADLDGEVAAAVAEVQSELFWLSADLAAASAARRFDRVGQEQVDAMEALIDRLDAELPPLKGLVLAGGSEGGARLHHARAVCRRAERALVALAETEAVDPVALRYLNRLSDLLFCLARTASHGAGVGDDLARS